MTSLAGIAEVVIGVDTHVRTHSAAAVDARTGGVLAEITVTADAGGYRRPGGGSSRRMSSRAGRGQFAASPAPLSGSFATTAGRSDFTRSPGAPGSFRAN